MQVRELDPQDLRWALRRLPKSVFNLLRDRGPKVFLAGGYVRSIVAGEKINDVDLFATSQIAASDAAHALAREVGGEPYETDNAFSVRTKPFMTQFIHRWAFADPVEALRSFDFTVAQAAIWFDTDGEWKGACSDRFYADLAAKRLVYTIPERNEDAGGSLLRVLKFYQRGYRIPLDSMGAVVARLVSGIHAGHDFSDQKWTAQVITGLLHEVDPAIDPTHMAHEPAMVAPIIPDEVF